MKEVTAANEVTAALAPEAPEAAPVTAKRLAVIHNPIAGHRRRHRYADFLTALRGRGLIVRELPTTCRGDAERWARTVSRKEGDMIVAAGGDGTINEVVNGLMVNERGGRDLPLAILPLGTANVLAAEIGLRDDIDSVVDCIAGAQTRKITLGRVNGRCFIVMAGIGFDAQVVAQVDFELKRGLGKLAYVVRVLQQLFTYDFPRYHVACDGKSFTAASLIVAKGRYYGGHLLMAPGVSLFDNSLEVVLFRHSGPWHALKYGAALVLGLLPRLRDVQRLQTQALRIEGPAGDPIQADGDVISQLPADITLVPQALRLVVPFRKGVPGEGEG